MAGHQSFLSILLIAVTALFAYVVQQNPLLFGRKYGAHSSMAENDRSYRIYTHHPVLEQHLKPFRDDVSNVDGAVMMSESDYVAYRNHCLRVLTFAVYHCGETCAANNNSNKNHWVDLMAMALAYHDIGLWSDRQLDYLQPSARQMRAHARANNDKYDTADHEKNNDKEEAADAIWSEADLLTAREIILQHHKFTEWTANSDVSDKEKGMDASQQQQQEEHIIIRTLLVNAVRKGDWADATLGLVRFGLPASLLERAYEQIPEAGFHALLLQMGSRLSPDSLRGRLDVLKILKW